jgi:hypothetical protein
MNLIMLFDFIQVLHIKRRLSTKDAHFSEYILFTMIYLLQEQKLNPRNCFEQEIIMSNFVQPKEYDMIMYAKFQCMIMHLFL